MYTKTIYVYKDYFEELTHGGRSYHAFHEHIWTSIIL